MYTLQFRRDTRLRWEEENPTLEGGEPGFEIDTGRLKIGDGLTPWSLLPYLEEADAAGVPSTELAAHINDLTPHPVYDDGPSLFLLYENAKV